MVKILVEGWRFIPNSFAVVNQFQCLELKRRHGIHVVHRDVPYWGTHWKETPGLLPPDLEQQLRSLPVALPGETADITLRMGCPFDFSTSDAERTVVFSTCEFGKVSKETVVGGIEVGDALAQSDALVITPSNWSRKGLINSGAPKERVNIISHGVDTGIFKPLSKSERDALRHKLGWNGSFIFLNIGAMTPNKGIDLALKAILKLSKSHPNIRLMLKGLDSLYPSGQHISNLTQNLSESDLNTLQNHVGYIGNSQSFTELSNYYQAADAYLSPYLGEGFNLPVVEAMACGLPVICTGGGSTDDFTTSDFALRIDSTLKRSRSKKEEKIFLVPDKNHLVELMSKVIDDEEWRINASHAATAYTNAHLTWKHVVDRLLDVLTDEKHGNVRVE